MSVDVQTREATSLLNTENMSLWKRITRVQAAQIVLVLIAICIVFSIMAPDAFPTVFNLRSIIVNTSIFAVLGVGATLVIITAGIDLSIGSVLIFSSVVAAKVMGSMGASGWGTAMVGVVVAVVAGVAVAIGGPSGSPPFGIQIRNVAPLPSSVCTSA